MQPHITPVSSALSSRHLPQSNNHHQTRVCVSVKARQTQILVSMQRAHTNAPSIGASRSGTGPVRPATARAPGQRPSSTRPSEIHAATDPPLKFPARRASEGEVNKSVADLREEEEEATER